MDHGKRWEGKGVPVDDSMPSPNSTSLLDAGGRRMSDGPGLASTYLPRQWGFSEPRKLSMVSKGDRDKKNFSPELRLFLEELGEIVKESLAERHRRQGTMRETKRQKEGEEDESGGILPGQ